MGYGRRVGRGCGEAFWGTEQRPEVSHFPVQSCGTRLRAEGRSFDVSGEQAVLMWRSPELMGLGGLTVSVHVSLSQRGADSAGLIETGTEKSAISPSAPARGDRSIA